MARPAECAWAIANSGNNHGTTPTSGGLGSSSTPLTFAMPAPGVTNGNLIIAVLQWGAATGTATFSKSAGTGTDGGWTTWKTVNDGTNGQSMSLGYALITGSGSYTVNATPGSSISFSELAVVEFSGNAASTPADVTAGQAVTASGNAFNSGNATTTVNGDLIFGVGSDDSGVGDLGAGSGFTVIDHHPAGTDPNYLLDEWQTQGTAGSINASFTNTANEGSIAIMATFKPTGGAVACSPSLASTGAGACE